MRSNGSRTLVIRSASSVTRRSLVYRSNNLITNYTAGTASRSSRLLLIGGRSLFTSATRGGNSFTRTSLPWLAGIVVGVASSATLFYASVDQEAVRKDIKAILNTNPKYDDGSYGPLLIRLAWHASGTYNAKTGTGGSNGATMRFHPESDWGANAGLKIARDLLEPIKKKYPELSYADLWTLAGCVAIEDMGGPHINWRSGRQDYPDNKKTPPDGVLPDADKGPDHIRNIFHRMGFNDQEIVALIGAHAVGRCHTDRSGYDGPWTTSPTRFTNEFFVQLTEAVWTERKWNGPKQFEDETKTMMMLPADMAFLHDATFKKYVEEYAKDEQVFFKDFAAAFSKLLHLGVPTQKCWKNVWGLFG